MSSISAFFALLDPQGLLSAEPTVAQAEAGPSDTEYEQARMWFKATIRRKLSNLPDYTEFHSVMGILIEHWDNTDKMKAELEELRSRLPDLLARHRAASKVVSNIEEKSRARKEQIDGLAACKKKHDASQEMIVKLQQKRQQLEAELAKINAELKNVDLGFSLTEKAILEVGQEAKQYVTGLNETNHLAGRWEGDKRRAEKEIQELDEAWEHLRMKFFKTT